MPNGQAALQNAAMPNGSFAPPLARSASSTGLAGSGSDSRIITPSSSISLPSDSADWGERDPRMLDCILVRHGESEGNIGQHLHQLASSFG